MMVLRFTADKPGRYTGAIRLVDAHQAKSVAQRNRITISGQLNNGLRYEAQALLLTSGGQVETTSDQVKFSGGNSLTLLLTGGTDYLNRSDKGWRGAHPHERLTRTLDNAARKPYLTMCAAHIADFQLLFNALSLETTNPPYSKLGKQPACHWINHARSQSLRRRCTLSSRISKRSCARTATG